MVTAVYSVDTLVRFFGLGWHSFLANGWNIFDFIVAGGSLLTTFIVDFGSSGYAIAQLQKLFLTSIAFKLVQRTNSLNKFFKTAVYVLSPLVNGSYRSSVLQREFTRNHQPIVLVVDYVLLFRHHVHGGLQHDEMELGGDQKPELHNDVESPRNAGVHDNRVGFHPAYASK